MISLQNGAVVKRSTVIPGSVMLAEPRWFIDSSTNTAVIYLIAFNSSTVIARSRHGPDGTRGGHLSFTHSYSTGRSGPCTLSSGEGCRLLARVEHLLRRQPEVDPRWLCGLHPPDGPRPDGHQAVPGHNQIPVIFAGHIGPDHLNQYGVRKALREPGAPAGQAGELSYIPGTERILFKCPDRSKKEDPLLLHNQHPEESTGPECRDDKSGYAIDQPEMSCTDE